MRSALYNDIFSILAPKDMSIIWVNTTALNITFSPASGSAEVEYYKAIYGDKSCEVNANFFSLRCTLGGLEGGTKYRVQGKACIYKVGCSVVLFKEACTLPDGK